MDICSTARHICRLTEWTRLNLDGSLCVSPPRLVEIAPPPEAETDTIDLSVFRGPLSVWSHSKAVSCTLEGLRAEDDDVMMLKGITTPFIRNMGFVYSLHCFAKYRHDRVPDLEQINLRKTLLD